MKKNAKGIGPGKKGSGKRLIYKAGGGRKALKTWRSISKPNRKTMKAGLKSGKYAGGIKGLLKSVRSNRKKAGMKPVPGRAPGKRRGGRMQIASKKYDSIIRGS